MVLIIFNQIGKFCYTFTYGAIYLIPPDIYPTNIRATGLGICEFSSMLGHMVAPLFRIIVRHFAPSFLIFFF